MNRGHALALKNDPSALTAALAAYDEAVARLRPLLADDAPASWTTSLAAALLNRGQLLHRLHGTAESSAALAAYDEAATLLRPRVDTSDLPPSASPWPRRNLAGVLLNRATLRLDLDRLDAARADAAEALALSRPHEFADTVDADLALKSRRALCAALGRLIVAPGADQEAIAREASDLVDDGLALARHWTDRGAARPRELAMRLFRFGAGLYRRHQPHFLAEFLAENLLTPDPELAAIARETIDAALADKPRDLDYLQAGNPATERHLRTVHALRQLRALLPPA